MCLHVGEKHVFFAQQKFREKLAPSPKVAAWSAAQEHWREENNAFSDGFRKDGMTGGGRHIR